LYDGSGKRIKKVTNLETTIFVYSGSKLIAEYSTQLATNPTTSYTVTDMLGSPRVITDANGQVISRRDFMAFGEEIANNVGGRTSANKYGQTDSVRQRFTGYQKDDETGLDFAEARYYNDAHGRFTAVDPLLASGQSSDPQTFNRYVYAMNRPLILTDPTGLQAGKKVDLTPDSSIVVPVNVRDEAARTTILGVRQTYVNGQLNAEEEVQIVLPDSLVQLKKDLADFAYTQQGAATSQAIANEKTNDISANQGTISNGKTESQEKENSKTAEVNVGLSTSPSLNGKASSTDANKIGSSSSDGKQLTGPSTSPIGTLNNLENQTNKAIGNYLNENVDQKGFLKVNIIDSNGMRWSSLNGDKIHLSSIIFSFQFHFKFHRAFISQT
jgi:RHS repeat-associated protein